MEKLSYIDWATFGKNAQELARQVKKNGADFDLVIGVAQAGIPLALAIADELDREVDIIRVKSYTGINKRTEPKILNKLSKNINGMSVLVVDDLVDHGITMNTLIAYLKTKHPKSITTAVLFKKPWSKFTPDFYLKTVDTWVVFPWNTKKDTKESKMLG